jgi:hypothetical protein
VLGFGAVWNEAGACHVSSLWADAAGGGAAGVEATAGAVPVATTGADTMGASDFGAGGGSAFLSHAAMEANETKTKNPWAKRVMASDYHFPVPARAPIVPNGSTHSDGTRRIPPPFNPGVEHTPSVRRGSGLVRTGVEPLPRRNDNGRDGAAIGRQDRIDRPLDPRSG